MELDPAFAAVLTGVDLDALDRDPGTIFGIWADGRLSLTNAAWERFAADNGAPSLPRRWPIGANVFDAIPGVLLPYYRAAWEAALRDARPWSHRYECSSPSRFRDLHMVAHPVGDAGLLVTNALVVERPHDPAGRPAVPPLPSEHRTARGGVVQCAECRRVRAGDAMWRWDWVPAWVAEPPAGTRSGLCEICFDQYYGSAKGEVRLAREPAQRE